MIRMNDSSHITKVNLSWSMLVLRASNHHLMRPVLTATCNAVVRMPAQANYHHWQTSIMGKLASWADVITRANFTRPSYSIVPSTWQLCMLAEAALMLQLEAPPAAGLSLPQELCVRAQTMFQQQQVSRMISFLRMKLFVVGAR